MRVKRIGRLLGIGLVMLGMPLMAVAADVHPVMFIIYSKDAPVFKGDNDHYQEIRFQVPSQVSGPLYLRIFDPDVGGQWDTKYEELAWNSKTRFRFSGKDVISEKEVGLDSELDNTWYTMARFDPHQGVALGDGYEFRLEVFGISGNDGNVFDVVVNSGPDTHRFPKGIRMTSDEPTIRLPNRQYFAQIRFRIPSQTSRLTIHNFDLAGARLDLTTAIRSEIPLKASGQGKWASQSVAVMEAEQSRLAALNYSGGREMPNDATFFIETDNGDRVPFIFPIHSHVRRNKRPFPRFDVTFLSDCYSVRFDASRSTDFEGDDLSYHWDFGDGTEGQGVQVTHLYAEQKPYQVTLTVTDHSGQVGNFASVSRMVEINRPPKADAGTDIISVPGKPVRFNGLASNDPEGRPLVFKWDFGDGKRGHGATPIHRYASHGNYIVKLQVNDQANTPCNRDWDEIHVRINGAPILEIGKNQKGAVGQPIRFAPDIAEDPDGDDLQFQWDFGDGSQENGREVVHAFQAPGRYEIRCTVHDDVGAENSQVFDTCKVVINDPPVPVMAPLKPVDPGRSVTFDGTRSHDPDGTLTSWQWDFGDGNLGTGPKPVHVYESPGVYTVRLTVTDDSGTLSASATTTQKVVVNEAPVPVAGEDQRVSVNELVVFDGSGSSDPDGKIMKMDWDFGDGNNAQGIQVQHAYKHPGTYRVKLTVTDDSGTNTGVQTDEMYVIVNAPPIADAGKDQMLTNSLVAFDASGSRDPDGRIIRYDWDFGDGTRGQGSNPTHVYGNPGTYSVTLVVTDDSQTSTNQASDTMRVIINHRPIADAGPDRVVATGETVCLDASESFDPDGQITRVDWDLGDGTHKSGQSVCHAYSRPGIYVVTQVVRDDTSHAMAFDTDSAKIQVNAPPVARIKMPQARHLFENFWGIAPGEELVFDASESMDPDGRIVRFEWYIQSPDAQVQTLMGEQVSHRFDQPGIYPVTLVVADNSGRSNAIAKKQVMIRVNHAPQFVPRKSIFTCHNTFRLDTANWLDPDGDPLTFEWDPGDGSPKQQGPVLIHTFKESGTYPVVVQADDGLGLANSVKRESFTITINAPPVANAGEDVIICGGDIAVFSGAASHDPEGGVLKYQWDFGDGTRATGVNPTKIYKNGGTYQVTLTVFDDSGLPCNASTDQMVVQVMEAPVARAGKDMTVCANTPVFFDGTASWDVDGQINSFFWEFGDGSVGGGPKPNHIYMEPGIYTVRLTITGESTGFCKSKDTDEIRVTVYEAPEPYIILPLTVAAGVPVSCDGSESDGKGATILAYEWDFGDGSKDQGRQVSHVWKKPGNYPVSLKITTDSQTSCNTVSTVTSLLVNASPVANAGGDKTVAVYQEVVLDASGSHDSDGSIISYEWDLGDGHTAKGVQVRHRYETAGTFPVVLKVVDNTDVENNWSEDRITVTVTASDPIILSMPSKACVGEFLSFAVTNPRKPSDQYRWNFGDSHDAWGTKVTHTYERPGNYAVTVTRHGKSASTNPADKASGEIVVNSPPQMGNFPQITTCLGNTVHLDAGMVTDPNGGTVRFQWEFPDGSTAQGPAIDHAFSKPGTHWILLKATDDSDTSCATVTQKITVHVNQPPIAHAGPDQHGWVGGANDGIRFDASESSDPDGDPLAYLWHFGDGTSGYGKIVFHEYLKPGTYEVRLEVSDGTNSGCDPATDTVTVTIQSR